MKQEVSKKQKLISKKQNDSSNQGLHQYNFCDKPKKLVNQDILVDDVFNSLRALRGC